VPILLTTPVSLSAQAASAFQTLGIRQVIVLGGPLAVSDAVVSQLESTGISVLRVSGTGYTGTAVALAELELQPKPDGAGWPQTGIVAVSRGDAYSDGLAGAVVAADAPSVSKPEPLLLTLDPTTVGTTVTAFLKGEARSLGVSHLLVLGGPEAVTETVAAAMLTDVQGG
jgi:putative cell wall-binding protein